MIFILFGVPGVINDTEPTRLIDNLHYNGVSNL